MNYDWIKDVKALIVTVNMCDVAWVTAPEFL